MSSLTARAPSVKVNRPLTARPPQLLMAPGRSSPGVVRIWDGKGLVTDYSVTALASDFGRGFRLEKLWAGADEEPYDVHLDHEGHASCDCLGFLRHDKCKHIASLRELHAAGRL